MKKLVILAITAMFAACADNCSTPDEDTSAVAECDSTDSEESDEVDSAGEVSSAVQADVEAGN